MEWGKWRGRRTGDEDVYCLRYSSKHIQLKASAHLEGMEDFAKVFDEAPMSLKIRMSGITNLDIPISKSCIDEALICK